MKSVMPSCQINEVTRQNAESARESSAASKILEKETQKLSLMVNKFQINGNQDRLTNA